MEIDFNNNEISPDNTPNIQLDNVNPDNIESVQSNGVIDSRRVKFFEKLRVSNLEFTPVNSDEVIATINASSEGITIASNRTEITSTVNDNSANITINADNISTNVTNINGNTSSISQNADAINLRVEKNDVINQINISTEGILIDASKINISGSTTFDSGYDPTTKVDEIGGSYNSAESGARVRIFPDANTGIQVIDNNSNDVFKVLVGGTDVGDVIIGNYSGGQGIKYDKSAGQIYYKNLAWSAVTNDNGNKPDDNADVTADNNQPYSWITGDKPPIDAEANPSYITSTKITSTTIESPLITGSAGKIGGWYIGLPNWYQLKSYGDKIRLSGGDASHDPYIRALYDSNNYIEMIASGSEPRLDLYKSGYRRTSLRDDGLYFYDSSGNLEGSVKGGSNIVDFDMDDIQIASNRVRIWASGVRVKNGLGFYMESNQSDDYFRAWCDSSSPYPGMVQAPASDQIHFQDNYGGGSGSSILQLIGKTSGLYDNRGLIDCFAGLRLLTTSSSSLIPTASNTVYVYDDGSVWQVRIKMHGTWYRFNLTSLSS